MLSMHRTTFGAKACEALTDGWVYHKTQLGRRLTHDAGQAAWSDHGMPSCPNPRRLLPSACPEEQALPATADCDCERCVAGAVVERRRRDGRRWDEVCRAPNFPARPRAYCDAHIVAPVAEAQTPRWNGQMNKPGHGHMYL